MKAKRRINVRPRLDRPGKWEVDYLNPPGMHPRRCRQVFDSEEEALAHAASVRKWLESAPVVVEDSDITLADYAHRRLAVWGGYLAARTIKGYEYQLRYNILPMLGSVRVREIKRREIKKLLATKQRTGLSAHTLRLIRATISSLLTDAMDDEIIESNPALQLGRKKGALPGRLTRADRAQHIRPMSRPQRDAFLAGLGPSVRNGVFFEVLAKAGLRPGEGYALKPTDVDLTAKTVTI